MSALRPGAALAAAVLSLMILCAPEAAAVPMLEAGLGFGSYAVPGRWMPLRIRCAEAPRSSTIEVSRVSHTGEITGTETFPVHGGTRIECPVRLSQDLAKIRVRLLFAGRTLAELTIDPAPRYFPGHLVLTVGMSAAARLRIAAALMPGEPMVVASVGLSDLPVNGLDYDGVSAVVVAASSGSALNPAQGAALRTWIACGGSLVVVRDRAVTGDRAATGLLDGLGLSAPKADADAAAEADAYSAFGLGRYRLIGAETGAAGADATDWRRILGLEPYGAASMIGAAAQAAEGGKEIGRSIVTRESRLVIFAILTAWAIAAVCAATFSRGKTAPVAAVAGIGLAVVLAGGGALDRSIARASRFKALALAVPDAGTAFISVRASAYELFDPFSWLGPKAVGPVSLSYMKEESGTFGSWNHHIGAATYSVYDGGPRHLALSALVEGDVWRAVVSPMHSLISAAPPRAEDAPPPIDSELPLAFLGSGDDGAWWTKAAGGDWVRSEDRPAWIDEDAERLVRIMKKRKDLAVLVGGGPATPLALAVQGGPLREELLWVMPIAEDGR